MALNSLQLFDLIETTLIKLGIKKNQILDIGKNPTHVNNDLRKVYSYWILLCDCSLTQSEIDCIVDSIRMCDCLVEQNAKYCPPPTVELYTAISLQLASSGGTYVTQTNLAVVIPCTEFPTPITIY